ncbi:MAG: DUF2807 domain-containing protein [Flavipsychrobacter sp.]|nr:DUF2807 domain-containing protein [Flavipsychrobacter sp.]
MKKGFLLFTVSLVVVLATSCGPRMHKPEAESLQVPVGEFNAVDIGAHADVYVTVKEGAAPSLVLKGYADVLHDISTEIKDNTLYIEGDRGFHFSITEGFSDKPRIEITVSSLSGLELSGAGDVRINGIIQSARFNLDLSGIGEVKIDELNADELSVSASGGGDVEIKKGIVRRAEYELSGAADVKTYGLQCRDVSVSVSGAGDVKLSVSDNLDVQISGAGDVKYKGNPVVTKNVSGAGDITQVN